MKSDEDRTLAKLILDSAQRSESRAAFSGTLTLQKILEHIESCQHLTPGQTASYLDEAGASARKLSESLLAVSRNPLQSEFSGVIERFLPKRVAEFVDLIVEIGGIDGKYSIDSQKISEPTIEASVGYGFSLTSAARLDEWNVQDPKVVVIDGVVEGVHEIHHLLEAASSAKIPVLLIARSFAEEVLTTLELNRRRGTLNILPISVPMEVDAINTIIDISVVAGCDVISSIKGQLISTIDFDKQPMIQEVRYRHGLLTLINPTATHRVELHRARIIEKKETSQAEMARYYDLRVKSLLPNHTSIKLPLSNDTFDTRPFAIYVSAGLKLFRSIHEAGIFDVENTTDVCLRHIISTKFALNQARLILNCGSLLVDDIIQTLETGRLSHSHSTPVLR